MRALRSPLLRGGELGCPPSGRRASPYLALEMPPPCLSRHPIRRVAVICGSETRPPACLGARLVGPSGPKGADLAVGGVILIASRDPPSRRIGDDTSSLDLT